MFIIYLFPFDKQMIFTLLYKLGFKMQHKKLKYTKNYTCNTYGDTCTFEYAMEVLYFGTISPEFTSSVYFAWLVLPLHTNVYIKFPTVHNICNIYKVQCLMKTRILTYIIQPVKCIH